MFKNNKITLPKKGKLSKPLLDSSDCTNLINYKLMVDKDPIHNTFRTIIKGGKIGPAFHESLSIVQSVDGSDNDHHAITGDTSTPAVSPMGASTSVCVYHGWGLEMASSLDVCMFIVKVHF